MRMWQKYNVILFWIAVILLLLVLTGIGKDANGAKRWIPLQLFNFQPNSRIAKLALTVLFGRLFHTAVINDVRRQKIMHLSHFLSWLYWVDYYCYSLI